MMERYHLPVSDKMIAQGDYSEFVDRQVDQLLDDNPNAEAIVFANDEMAFAGYRVCEKRGLKVGKDILITGFDDCERASGHGSCTYNCCAGWCSDGQNGDLRSDL